MTTKINNIKNSHTLLIFGIAVFSFGIFQLLGFIDDLRLYFVISKCASEQLQVGKINVGAGLLIMIGGFLLCFISQLGSALAIIKTIRGK